MKLADLKPRVVSPLGEWPEPTALTPAQIAQRQCARKKQAGQPKKANRFQR